MSFFRHAGHITVCGMGGTPGVTMRRHCAQVRAARSAGADTKKAGEGMDNPALGFQRQDDIGEAVGTLAEGVESKEHLTRLEADGCASLQGYFFGKPVPADQLAEIILRLCPQEKHSNER